MRRFRSPDGTSIAAHISGEGRPLVLVHGTTADHGRWAPILPGLRERFTVYALDRRGRGESGDAPDYAIEREFEDVAAVIDGIGGSVDVLGHSYGALCALEAAARVASLRRMVLYEPPVIAHTTSVPPGLLQKLEATLAAGDREGVVVTFLTEMVRMPPAELALFRSRPAWPARVAAAHTIPRELRASDAYAFVPERIAAVRAPTLIVLGGDSPPFFRQAAERVQAALPDARIAILAGQQHGAIDTAPDLFLRQVVSFLGT